MYDPDDYLLNELANELTDEQPLVTDKDNPINILVTLDSKTNKMNPHPPKSEEIVFHTNKSTQNKESVMDSVDNRTLLNPATPRESAEIFINQFHRKLGIRDLQCVPTSGEFYVWKDNYYQRISDLSIQAQIARFLHSACKSQPAKGIEPEKKVSFNTDSAKENRVLDALKCISCDGIGRDPSISPSWIFCSDPEAFPNPENIVPFKNKLLSIDTYLKTANAVESLSQVTPQFFCSTQIPFDINPFDQGRLLPTRFLSFLEEVFNDQSSIDFLQQWFGYCLTNMTWAQKILLIIGPKRSGKGTIARVLQSMLGAENFISPSASGMITTHGMESWLNKRLAVFGDARFGDKLDKDAVKEYLLQISGEDSLTIPRKFKSSVSARLPTKIMILSNEIPDIKDSGAALASRFIVLKMEKSVFGRENVNLFDDELKPEIPKIFWWALDGLRKLMASKAFVQPSTGKESAAEMERMQSPITAFVSDYCNVRPGIRCSKDVLYAGYKRWCESEDIKPLHINYFARYLYSACHSVKPIRPREGEIRFQEFDGISLKDRS